MFKPQHPPKKRSERKNKPRRVTDSSRAERVKLTQFQFNQRKTRTHETTQKPPHKNEIKLGIDFWHAVEFSRIARTPTRHLPAAHRGNRSNLPDPPSPVKRALIRGSGLVLQGLACWAVDDFSTVFAPSLTTRIRPWAHLSFEHAARSNVEALQLRSPPRARPVDRRPCDEQGRIRPFPRARPRARSRPVGPLCGDH